MVVAGGWRCAVNINAASPRLSGSIGVMVGGKWIYGSVRSFILLPKAPARSPCRWVLVRSLSTPRSEGGVSFFVACPVRCWMNGMDSLIWRALVIGRLHCSASEWWHVCGCSGMGEASTADRKMAVAQAVHSISKPQLLQQLSEKCSGQTGCVSPSAPHLDWLKWAHLFHLVSVEMLLLRQPELWCFKHHH